MRLKKCLYACLCVLILQAPIHAIADLIVKEEGDFACSVSTTSSITVIYVNGIDNSFPQAMDSMSELEKMVDEFCETCKVSLSYNRDDGDFDDIAELALVAETERTASDAALSFVVKQVIIDTRKFIETNNVRSTTFIEADLGLLERIGVLAEDNRSDPILDPEIYGQDVKKYLNTKALLSPVTKAIIENNGVIYNVFFKQKLYQYFRVQTASFRDVYQNSNKHAASIANSVTQLKTDILANLQGGKKVVVVAHSQGNHIIEIAYSDLLQSNDRNAVLNSLRVVNVASVALSSPNDRYVSWNHDHIITRLYDIRTDGAPLVPNFISPNDDGADGANDHSFTEVYLNSNVTGKYQNAGQEQNIRGVIKGLIQTSIEEATFPQQIISSEKIITARIDWTDYDDMDLWTKEPDGTFVSYQNKQGTFGVLDYDDTDGEGPEHYFADLGCASLVGREWLFGIHQYSSGGSKASVQFTLSLGGNSLIWSKSIVSTSWPSNVQWIGSLNFGELSEGNKIAYSFELNDLR